MPGGHTEEFSDYIAKIEAYAHQNIPQLHNLILRSKEEGDNMDAFLDERNEKWIDRMADRMDQKSVFFCRGCRPFMGRQRADKSAAITRICCRTP